MLGCSELVQQVQGIGISNALPRSTDVPVHLYLDHSLCLFRGVNFLVRNERTVWLIAK